MYTQKNSVSVTLRAGYTYTSRRKKTDMEDVDLVQASLGGDQAAFTELVERYQTRVYSLAYRMLGPAEAEDAAQEGFIKAYLQLASYKSEYRFSSWLLAITANHCIDVLRRRKRLSDQLQAVGRDLPTSVDAPELALVESESRRRVQDLVIELPATHRAVIVLHYWHELSCNEIGQMLGLSENCVLVRLHRARHLLATRMAEQQEREVEVAHER
jgi:RNA polymerase sigma-70 factor (ECF subfamily)